MKRRRGPLHDIATQRIARGLGVTRCHAAGIVLVIVETAAAYYPGGVMKDVDADDLAAMCDWSGDAAAFLRALMDAKLIGEDRGRLVILDWLSRRPVSIDARDQKRKRRGAKGSHTKAQWLARAAMHGWRCVYCAAQLDAATVTKDHVIPICDGGTDFASNLVPACKRCNSQKGGRKVATFLRVVAQRGND